MCRLFFSFRNKSIKPLLQDFLAQSIHKTKNTPMLNNRRDHITHTDGFGIAWTNGEQDLNTDKETNLWKIYKQPKLYTEDSKLDAVLDTIPNNIVIAHIRKKTYGNASMENTHPFHYDDQIFVQNGKIGDFQKHISLLQPYMYLPLSTEIRGETDTEYLFFMFLSCKKYLEQRKGEPHRYFRKNTTRKVSAKNPEFSKSQVALYENVISHITLQTKETRNYEYINTFRLLTGIFREHSIELVANIIYANSNIVLFSRYIYYDKTKYNDKQIPTSLYWNKCKTHDDNGILITSEPLSKYHSVLFPENSVAILDYKKYDFTVQKILY
jgi:predicted glutamine amidotransferase